MKFHFTFIVWEQVYFLKEILFETKTLFGTLKEVKKWNKKLNTNLNNMKNFRNS